jgi:glycosyltransferase involved in cell wall biosynthesis
MAAALILTMQTSANNAPAIQAAPVRTVLCLHGTRSMNRRVALFFECLQRDGFGIRVFALPRHRWVFDKSDAPLDLQRTGRCTAEIGLASSARRASAIFCFHWAVLPLAVFLGLLRGIPVVYDEHDHYELNTLEGSGPKLKLLLFSRCVRWIHRFCLPWVCLVTCIHQAHSTLLLHLQRWQRNIVALHNYPSQIWRNTVPGIPLSDRLCFVYIGGVYAEKGVLTAADAFDLLPDSLKQQAELHIFGDGDRAVIELLRKRAGLHVHNNVAPVLFRQFAVQHRCVGLALLADTPRYQLVGTNCTKLWEYLALGMPVIVSDVGELSRAVVESQAGLEISARLDPADLTAAMTTLLQNPAATQAMSQRAATLMKQPGMTWEDEWQKVRRSLPAFQ